MASEYQSLMAGLAKAGISADKLVLPTTLGPITVQDLPFLEGWRWSLFELGYPGNEQPLTIGGPAVVLADYTDEKGWLMLGTAFFRSPFCALNYSTDSFAFAITPFMVNLFGLNSGANNIAVWSSVYNPATAFGPLYSVCVTPAYPIPYSRRLSINFTLPVGSPVAASTVFYANIGKIYIVDEATFLRSIKRHSVEQMVGVKQERYL